MYCLQNNAQQICQHCVGVLCPWAIVPKAYEKYFYGDIERGYEDGSTISSISAKNKFMFLNSQIVHGSNPFVLEGNGFVKISNSLS